MDISAFITCTKTLHSNNAFSFMNLQVDLSMLKATGFKLQCILLNCIHTYVKIPIPKS